VDEAGRGVDGLLEVAGTGVFRDALIVVVEDVGIRGLGSVPVLKPKVFLRTGWSTRGGPFGTTADLFDVLLFLTAGPSVGLVGLLAKGEFGSEGA
jgi:hypothetical protein